MKRAPELLCVRSHAEVIELAAMEDHVQLVVVVPPRLCPNSELDGMTLMPAGAPFNPQVDGVVGYGALRIDLSSING